MRRKVSLTLIAIVLAAGCGSSGGGGGGGVDWKNYAPSVKSSINAAASSGDCASLQQAFDNAEANDAAQRSRTGDGNADLMAYIDDRMSSAGCYD